MNFRDWNPKLNVFRLFWKAEIEAYIEAHAALLSSVRQIPQETLAEIFMHFPPTEPPYAVRSFE
ncbi:hypothetical protein BT96DRAFT_913051 [Gymnopus androsaceus JB14]|uniref:F-box domain-containing protein n=1 Tax=Gymnopus androsaceus JB14 TaxID=1447944 RepID=A0A6A4IKM3_9AGAR|nr:hypothetical protein BT96DRAFT_913051 [Gymnopus androsaceus JB14]